MNLVYFCCRFLVLLLTCWMVLVLMLDFNQFPLDYDQLFVIVFQSLLLVSNFRLQVCKWFFVSNKFSSVCSYSILRLPSSCNDPDQVVAFWITCFKNILIYLMLSIRWPKTETNWVTKNYRFSIWIGSTIG